MKVIDAIKAIQTLPTASQEQAAIDALKIDWSNPPADVRQLIADAIASVHVA